MKSCLPFFRKNNQDVNECKTIEKISAPATKQKAHSKQQRSYDTAKVEELPSPFIRNSVSGIYSNVTQST
jgi:hypothetical protein